MNLDELVAKLPEELQPIGREYGPALVKMGADEVAQWINRLAKGDVEGAYRQVLDAMDNESLSAEWSKLNSDWQTANVANAERINLQRRAMTAVMQVLLSMGLAMVGL